MVADVEKTVDHQELVEGDNIRLLNSSRKRKRAALESSNETEQQNLPPHLRHVQHQMTDSLQKPAAANKFSDGATHYHQSQRNESLSPLKKRKRLWSVSSSEEGDSVSSLSSSSAPSTTRNEFDNSAIFSSIQSKEDVEKLQLHNEKMRDYVVQQLAMLLGERTQWKDAQQAARIAARIEEAMQSHFKSQKAKTYKDQFSALRFNIRDKNNDNFWRRIWDEEASPDELATMHSLDMAANAKKKEREKLHEDFLISSIKPDIDIADVNLIVCPKCGHKNLRVVHQPLVCETNDRSLKSSAGEEVALLISASDEDLHKGEEKPADSGDTGGLVKCTSCGVDLASEEHLSDGLCA